jgi:hypothetical protein
MIAVNQSVDGISDERQHCDNGKNLGDADRTAIVLVEYL